MPRQAFRKSTPNQRRQTKKRKSFLNYSEFSAFLKIFPALTKQYLQDVKDNLVWFSAINADIVKTAKMRAWKTIEPQVSRQITKLSKKANQELQLFKNTKFQISCKPLHLMQGGLVFVFTFSVLLFAIWLATPKLEIAEPELPLIKTATTKQISPTVAGQPVKWLSIVGQEDVTSQRYLLQLPKQATDIKIKEVTKEQALSMLSESSSSLTLQDRRVLAQNFQNKNREGVFLASLTEAFDSIKTFFQNIFEKKESKLVDLSKYFLASAKGEQGQGGGGGGGGGGGCPGKQTNPYYKCQQGTCVKILECGNSSCASDTECSACPGKQTNPHNECQGSSCASIAECGNSTCSSDTECSSCPGKQTNPYYKCQQGTCVKVLECGNSSCTLDSDCNQGGGGDCPGKQTNPHNECQGSSCASVAECGNSSCSSDAECSACPGKQTNPYYKCQQGKCVQILECGTPVCTSDSDCNQGGGKEVKEDEQKKVGGGGGGSAESWLRKALETESLSNKKTEEAKYYAIEYTTPGVTAREEKLDKKASGKKIKVEAPPITRYKDVLVYATIPEIFKNTEKDRIKVRYQERWKTDYKYPDFEAFDLNSNGKIDYIEWTVPDLGPGEITYEIIYISKAFHLDQNQNIVEDIYDQVRTKEATWQEDTYSAIPQNHYVRVTFQQILDSTKDITLYARPNFQFPISNFQSNSNNSISQTNKKSAETAEILGSRSVRNSDPGLPPVLSIANQKILSRVWPESCSEQALGGGRQGICTPRIHGGNPGPALSAAHRNSIIPQNLIPVASAAEVAYPTIEVYPVYTDADGNKTQGQLLTTFPAIDHEDTYKIYLTDLATPTDEFDLKVVGGELSSPQGIDIDWIVDPTGWLTGWSYRKKITIAHTNVDADLTDFPLLVKITSDTNIGANALSSGYDLRFTSSDGTTLLSYEREDFSITGGAATGDFWVKVPTISSTADTTIYAYYGKSDASDGQQATSVWDSNFKGVWHLKETGNGTLNEFVDSTSNANHGQGGGGTAAAVPTQAVAKVGNGQTFDGTDDYVNVPHSSGLNIISGGNYSISSWLRYDGSAWNVGYVLAKPSEFTLRGYGAWDLQWAPWAIGDVFTTGTVLLGGAWHHIAARYDGTTTILYVDGSQAGTSTGLSTPSENNDLWIGDRAGGFANWNGLIDEVRISNSARSAAWIKFEYNNMNSVGNELTFATQEGFTGSMYWVGGTGNWSDSTHWALTSGGTGGTAGVPSSTDNVVFDSNSGTGIVTINSASVSVTNLTQSSANITIATGANALNVSGIWAGGGGTVTGSGAGAIVLNGSSQSITGSTTFYNLTKTVTSADTLTITAGTTQTIAAGGKLTLRGASGQLLTLASSTTSAYTIAFANTTAKYVTDYLSVSYLTATGLGIVALNSTDGGNNTGFTVQTTSGTLRYWIATSSANWNDTANWSTTSGGSGGSSVPTTTSDAIFDGNGNGDSTVNATVSVKGLYLAGYSGTFTQGAYAITVGADNYAQGTGTFTGYTTDATKAITLNGSFTLSGGTFTATSGTMTANGNWTYSGGTFTPGTGTVKFYSLDNATSTITGSHTLNNVEFSMSGNSYGLSIASGTTLTVTGTLTTSGSYLTLSGTGTINAQGDVTITNTNMLGSGTITININGTGTQTLTGTGQNGLPNTNINKSSGTLNLVGNITALRNWTYTQGTINAGTSTVKFYSLNYATSTITGSHTLNNVEFSMSGNSYGLSIASGTTFTVTGTLTTSGSYLTLSGTGTINAQGDVTIGSINNSIATALTFSGSNDTTFTNSGGTNPSGTWTINKDVGKKVTLASALSVNTAGQDLAITSGTLDLAGYALTVNDQFTIGASGTLQMQGGETISKAPTSNSGTVTYNGTSGPYTIKDWTYTHLAISGSGATFNLPATKSVTNATVSAGTLGLGAYNLNVSGNWAGGGTVTGTGTVTLNGTSQSITGSTTFYNLTKTVTSADTLTITAGTIQTIAAGGKLTLRGAASNLLTLASSTTSAYTIAFANTTAKYVIDYVSASYTTATGLGIVALNSTDGGNNTGFTVQTTSGTLRYWIATSSANWNDTANWSTTSGGSGGSSVPTTTDDAIFDGSATGDCAVNATVSVKGLYLAGYSGTFTQGAYAITVGADNYAQGSGTFTGSGTGSAITLNGSYTLSGGTFTATSGTLTMGNSPALYSWSVSGSPTFNANNGRIKFYQSGGTTFTPGNVSYYDIESSVYYYTAGALIVSGTVNVTHDLILTYGYIYGTINVGHDVNITGTSNTGFNDNGYVVLNGTGNQTITSAGGNLTNVTINKPSGTVILGSNITLHASDYGCSWTWTAADGFNPGTYKITFGWAGGGCTFTPGSVSYYDIETAVVYYSNNKTTTISGTANVTHDLVITKGYLSGGTVNVGNNVTIASTSLGGTAALTFTGSSDSTYTNSGGTNPSGTFTINKDVGKTVTLASALSVNTAGQDLAITSGTLDLAGYNLTVNDQFTIGASGTLKLTGDETVNKGPTSITSGGTVEYSATSSSRAIKNWTYTNGTIKINGSGGTFTLPANPSCSAVNVAAGTLDLNGQNLTSSAITVSDTLKLQGGEAVSSTPTLTGSTVNYTGTSGPYTIKDWTYNNLTISGSGATFNLPATKSITNATVSAGTLGLGSYNLNVSGNWSGGGTVTGSGAVVFNGSSQAVSGSSTFNNLTFTAPQTVTFTAGTTQTIGGTMTCTGTSGNLITLASSAASQFNLSKSSGTVDCDYISVSYSNATGGATFNPGTHSTDGGNNTGWVFNTAPTLTSVAGSPDPIKGGSTVTITPTGQADTDSDALYFYCNESGSPTSANTLCSQASTSYASPYSAMTCTYAVATGDTTRTVYCRVYDGTVYNSSDITTTYTVDTTAPSTPGTPSTTTPTNDTTPTWTWAASTDAGSGLASTPYTVQWCSDSGFTQNCGTGTRATAQFTHADSLADGIWYLRVKAADAVGNVSDYSTAGSVAVDATAPTTTASVSASDGAATATLTCSDGSGSGCSATYYCTDTTNSCAPSTAYSSQFNFTYSTTTYLRFYSVDAASNQANVSLDIISVSGGGRNVEIITPWSSPSPEATAKQGQTPAEVAPQGVLEQVAKQITQITKQVAESPKQLAQNIQNISEQVVGVTKQIAQLVVPPFGQPRLQGLGPLAEAVPKEAPLPFQNWEVMRPKEVGEIFISPVDSSIGFFIDKLPRFKNILSQLGIKDVNNKEDVKKLVGTDFSFPGLTETLLAAPVLNVEELVKGRLIKPGLEVAGFVPHQGLALADLTGAAKEKIPTDIVFAKSAGELIDYNMNLSVDEKGKVQQKITTIIGKLLELVIKPDKPAKRVIGFVVMNKEKISQEESGWQNILKYFGAALSESASPQASLSNSGSKAGTQLLLQKFEYSKLKGGVFKAQITAPVVEGEYEIVTIIEYEDPSLELKETRMITVVDPEGYVFTRLPQGKLRVSGAEVSLYWLNTKEEKYELWDAEKFLQKNPILTDDTGRYSFLVPEGAYYLKVAALGYKDYQSEPFLVKQGNGIHIDVELKPKTWLPEWINWSFIFAILLGIIIIMLGILIIVFLRKK